MPLYDYECGFCGTFAQFRVMAQRDAASSCPICDGPAVRVISAPNLAVMQPLQRMAATRNERSQHEPRVGVKSACCSRGKCAQHRPSKKNPEGKPPLQASTRKNRRPWMLGH